jgi:hypothetical protein
MTSMSASDPGPMLAVEGVHAYYGQSHIIQA